VDPIPPSTPRAPTSRSRFASRHGSSHGLAPELKEAALGLRRIALDLDVARNSCLPRLDLRGGVGPWVKTSTTDPLRSVAAREGLQWTAGASLSWAPLGGAAQAERRRLESSCAANGLSATSWWCSFVSRSARPPIDRHRRAGAAGLRQVPRPGRAKPGRRAAPRFLNGLPATFIVAQRQAELSARRGWQSWTRSSSTRRPPRICSSPTESSSSPGTCTRSHHS